MTEPGQQPIKPRRAWPAVVLALATSAPAFAQVPPSSLPTREELQAGAPPTEPGQPARRQHHLHVEDNIERSPCALDDPSYANIRIRITKATFAHLGPVPEAAIAASWQAYIGTDQPINVVCRIRDSAATTLRAMGYIAAVEVPVQRIVNGEVRFEVLYARVTSIRVIGQPRRDAGLLEAYLSHLVNGQIFNRFQAERSVLLAQDIPGYDIHLTLKPSGTGAGNMIAEVRVDDTPLIVDFTASDLSAPSTGRVGGQLRATINGLTGLGDQTTLSAYSSSEFRRQQIYQIGHQFMLGASGLQLSGHVTYAVTRPNLGPQTPPIDAHTLYINAEALYPLVRSQALSLHGALGLDVVNQSVSFAGAPLSRDHLRVGYLRFDLDTTDMKGLGPDATALWRINASAEIRHGFGIFGASPDCLASVAVCSETGFVPPGVPDGDPQATIFRASATIDLHAVRWLDLSIAPRVQLASAPVLGFEQFSLGNYTVGRGYAPGAIAGDDGAAFSIEARGPVFRLSASSHVTLQPYAFSDNGWAWRRMSAIPNPQELHSLGFGLRTGFKGAQLDLAAAIPVTRLPGQASRPAPLFLATFTAMILPWRYR
jgi:hemolysin activation/secretion protein